MNGPKFTLEGPIGQHAYEDAEILADAFTELQTYLRRMDEKLENREEANDVE
jgi:hypothetical protein